jgi:hypothetical protein
MLWKEAGEHEVGTQRVFTHLIKTNNLAGLEFFLIFIFTNSRASTRQKVLDGYWDGYSLRGPFV